jgi:hypothetical protein
MWDEVYGAGNASGMGSGNVAFEASVVVHCWSNVPSINAMWAP